APPVDEGPVAAPEVLELPGPAGPADLRVDARDVRLVQGQRRLRRRHPTHDMARLEDARASGAGLSGGAHGLDGGLAAETRLSRGRVPRHARLSWAARSVQYRAVVPIDGAPEVGT